MFKDIRFGSIEATFVSDKIAWFEVNFRCKKIKYRTGGRYILEEGLWVIEKPPFNVRSARTGWLAEGIPEETLLIIDLEIKSLLQDNRRPMLEKTLSDELYNLKFAEDSEKEIREELANVVSSQIHMRSKIKELKEILDL